MQAGPEEHQGALIVVGSISAATSGQGNKKERNETCGCTVGITCHLRFFLAISKRQKCREHYLPQSIAQSLFLPRDLYRCHRLGMAAAHPSPALGSCRSITSNRRCRSRRHCRFATISICPCTFTTRFPARLKSSRPPRTTPSACTPAGL